MGVKYDKKGNAIYTVDKGIDLNHKAKFDKSKIQMSSAQRKSYADDKKKKNKKTKQTKSQASKRNSGITGGAAQAAKEYRKKNPKKKTEKKKNTAREYSKKIRDQKLTSNEKLLLQNLTRTGSPEVVRKGLQSAGKTLTTSKAKTKEYKNLNKRVAKQDEKFLNSSPAAYGFMAGSSPIPLKETLERQTGKKINSKKAENSRGYKAGYMGGLMAEYTLTGGLARASAQKGIEIGAKQLAKNTSKKAIAKVVKKGEKLPKAVKRISSGLAADTITGLPTNALEAGKESMTAGKGKKGKTFAKSLALNTALDVGFGGAMEALPAAVKGAKAAKASRSSYIPKDTVPRKSKKVYKEYTKANDKGMIEFAKGVEAGKPDRKAYEVTGSLNDRHRERIKELTGVDTAGYKVKLRGQTLEQHINPRHGVNGKADRSMADKNDLSRMGYIIDNADQIDYVYDKTGNPKVSREYTNKDSTRAKMIMFQKRIDGHYYVVTAVPDTKDKSLQVVSTYIKKDAKKAGQTGNVGNPSQYVQNASEATTFDNSVAPIDRTVNDAGVKKTAHQVGDVLNAPLLTSETGLDVTVNNSISPVKATNKNMPEEMPDVRKSIALETQDENGVYNRLRKASERLYGEESNKYLPDARNIKMVEADNELPAVENTNMGIRGAKNTGEREPIENVFEGKASINEEWKALEASQDDDKRWQTFINDFAETREYDTKTTGMGLAQTAENISNKGVSRGKDIQRNADAAFAHDPAGRQAFKRNVEDPLYISKGRYAKAVQRKTDDLYNYVVKKLGIKKSSKESAAVQWYGEGLKVEKGDGKLKEIPYTLEDLKKDYSYTAKNGRPAWENIVEAEKYTRKLYDEYFDRLQKTLIEIYPDVEKNVEKLEKKLADLRSGTRVKRIEKRITDAKAKGQTDEELQDVYEALERAKDEMSEAGVKKIEREIFDAKNNKRLYKRNDYFRHFKDLQNGFFKDLSDIMNSSTDIDPRLLNLSEFTQPKSKWTGFLQKREGALGYKADAIGGLLEYIPQAEYKINIEPNIPNLRNAIKELQLATYKSKNANKFIDELVQVANDLAGKTNKIDRIPGMLLGDKKGRQLINGLTNISNRIRANAVVGNFNTVLAQFFNMPNVVAYAKNPADIVSGMSTSLRAVMGDKNAKEVLDKSMFLKERYLDRSMRRFNTGVLDNVNNFCGWMLEIGDKAVADAAFCTFYKQAKRKGLPELEAVLKADELTRKSVAGRGIAEMPLSQKAKLTKLLAPFQVEVRNAVNVMTELIGKKDAAGLIALFGLSWMMNEALDATTGRRIIFDPIEVLKNGYEEYREDENLEEAAKNTAANMFGEILTNIPGGTYAADIISDTMGISDLQKAKLFGENDPTRYGTGNIALQTLLKPAAQAIQGKNVDLLTPSLSLVLPFGGKQIQRTMSGMQDMGVLPDARLNFNDGINFEFSRNEMPGSYSDSGNLRFAIDPTEANYITAGTLGTWSTKQGKEYLKAGSSPLSERQTAATKGAYKAGMKPSEAEAFIRNLPKKAQDARGQIYRSNLTNAQKNAIGKAIDDGDKTVDYSSKTSYKYSMLNKQQKEKVDELRDKGFTKEYALKIRETVKGQSSQMAQVMALEGTGYDTPEVYAALGIKKSKRGNGPREKAKMLSSQGLSIHDFDAVKEAADVNGSGNVSIEEAMAFLDDTAYTRQECYALTFALTGCKHGNNPYR